MKSPRWPEVFDDYWGRIEERYRKQYSEGDVLLYGKYVVYLNNCFLETRFPRGQGIRSLEFGAGRGDTSLYFAKRGYTTFLLDLSVKALTLATRNFLEEGVTTRCVQADVFQSSFKGDTFDVVMSVGLLGHMEDVALPVREMVRVLKPGGVFCSTFTLTNRFTVQTLVDYCYHIPGTLVKNLLLAQPRRAIRMARAYLEYDYFENNYSEADYLDVLRECGLTDVGLYRANFFPYIRLPRLLERGYILIIHGIILFRRLIGVAEPYITRSNLGKTRILFGRKPQVS